jgi:hypothetical protein
MIFGVHEIRMRRKSLRLERPEMTADNSPSRNLIIADPGALPAALEPELEEAAGYARAEKAAATRRAYSSDFALFRTWCDAKGVPSEVLQQCSAETVRRDGENRKHFVARQHEGLLLHLEAVAVAKIEPCICPYLPGPVLLGGAIE